MSDDRLSGALVLDALHRAGVTHVISVPDLGTSKGLLWPLVTDARFKLVRICREEEGVGLCAGLIAAGQRPVMLIQYTGLLASMNALRAIALEYREPICTLVGVLFDDAPDDPRHSANLGVSRILPTLDGAGLRHHVVSHDAHVADMERLLERAFSQSEPINFILARHPH
jgi:sulfopyruvate decarboxylase TPP-binding subunit